MKINNLLNGISFYTTYSINVAVCSLVAETKREGFVDATQAYNKIVNSIKEAEKAAKMADKAANDTLEVQVTHTIKST